MAQGIMIGSGGGGNRYSLLTVTTEESTLQSESVTITGTDPVTGKVDTQTKRLSNGTVTVKLKYLTTYTITCGEATAEVNVTAYSDYTAEMSLVLWIFNNGVGAENIIRGASYGTFTVDDVITLKGTSEHSASFVTTKAYDFTKFTKLVIVGRTTNSSTSTTSTSSTKVFTSATSPGASDGSQVGIMTGNSDAEYVFQTAAGINSGYVIVSSGLGRTVVITSIRLEL